MNKLYSSAWSLRFWIFTVYAPLMIGLVAALLLVYEREVRRVTLDNATRELQQVALRAGEALARAQEPARAWLTASSVAPWAGRIQDDEFSFARVFMATQARYPQLGSLYFGYDDGGFARVLPLKARSPDHALVKPPPRGQFAEHLVRPGRGVEIWRFFDAQLEPVLSEQRPFSGFDPRRRPWYQKAMATPGRVITTEPYLFSATNELGITLASTVRGQPGVVAGADIALSDLSAYLRDQLPNENAKIVLFDALGNVWATSEPTRLLELLKAKSVPTLKAYGGAPYEGLLSMASAAPDITQIKGLGRYLKDDDSNDLLVAVGAVTRLVGVPVFVAVLMDRDALLADVYRLRRWAMGLGLLGLLGAASMAYLAARRVAKPLQALSQEARRFTRFEFDEPQAHAVSNPQSPTGVREVDQLHDSLQLARVGLAGYARYVPRPLVQHLLANRVEPKPSAIERDITMLIAAAEDVLRFSRLMSAKRFVERTEEYLQGVTDAITSNEGTIDKFYGDALVAFFNAPVQTSRHPALACTAALMARDRLIAAGELAKLQGEEPIHARYAIHTGVAVVGNFGTTERLNYTAVGAAPSLTSRLLRFNRLYRAQIIVTESVKVHVDRTHVLRWLDKVEINGLDRPIELYELLSLRDGSEESLGAQNLALRCEQAHAWYRNHEWSRAHQAYLSLAVERPYDAYVKLMAARTFLFTKDPPPQDWDMIDRPAPRVG